MRNWNNNIQARQSKFNVGKDKKNREYNGIVFDSALEMKYYRDVITPLLLSGEIIKVERQKDYTLQPKFCKEGKTIPAIIYKADFVVQYSDGREQVIDIKGYADAVAKLKRKIFWYVYPDIDYVWIGYSRTCGGWTTYENIQTNMKKKNKN